MKSFLHRKHKEDKPNKIPAPSSSSSPPSAGNLSDSEFAHKLAQEEEDAARGALKGRNGAEVETPLGDSAFAKLLAAQENNGAFHSPWPHSVHNENSSSPLLAFNWATNITFSLLIVGVELTDSDFARLVEAEDRFSAQTSQPLPSAGDHHQPLTDSEFAHRLQLQISSSSAPPSPAISSNALSKVSEEERREGSSASFSLNCVPFLTSIWLSNQLNSSMDSIPPMALRLQADLI